MRVVALLSAMLGVAVLGEVQTAHGLTMSSATVAVALDRAASVGGGGTGRVATPVVIARARGGSAAPLATPTATPAPTPAPTSTPTPQPQANAPLRLLHDSVSLRDESGSHGGAPALTADTGILIDIDRRTILWERDPHQPHAPASTTKVMTSLVVLENLSPSQQLTITPDALTQASDETVMGLAAGEKLSVSDLLSGMLLVSGNDAATSLATDGMGYAKFIDAMNQQEAALGLHDSHWNTPVGLDDPAHQVSAYDLAAVGMEDITHFSAFRNIVRQTDISIPQTADHPAFGLHNLNRLLSIYPAALGIKPGWTGDAGPSLVAFAERHGDRLIGVLLNERQNLYGDMRNLLEWGFAQYGMQPMPGLTPA